MCVWKQSVIRFAQVEGQKVMENLIIKLIRFVSAALAAEGFARKFYIHYARIAHRHTHTHT